MARIKRGVTAHRKHKRLLESTKGQRATRHALVKRAREAATHSMRYATVHRRERKGDMRRLWIARINAAAKASGVTYSQLINALGKSGVDINRKVLADLAVTDKKAFAGVLTAAGININ